MSDRAVNAERSSFMRPAPTGGGAGPQVRFGGAHRKRGVWAASCYVGGERSRAGGQNRRAALMSLVSLRSSA